MRPLTVGTRSRLRGLAHPPSLPSASPSPDNTQGHTPFQERLEPRKTRRRTHGVPFPQAGGQRDGEGPDGTARPGGRPQWAGSGGQEPQVSKGWGRGEDSPAPDCQLITRPQCRGRGQRAHPLGPQFPRCTVGPVPQRHPGPSRGEQLASGFTRSHRAGPAHALQARPAGPRSSWASPQTSVPPRCSMRLPELRGPLCQGGTGSPAPPPRGGEPWPRGLHLHPLPSRRAPCPALCPQTARPAHIPTPPGPGLPQEQLSPGPGGGGGGPGAEPLGWNTPRQEPGKPGSWRTF